jgi:hypothetical protein
MRFDAGDVLAGYKVTTESEDVCGFGFDPLWFLPIPSWANPFSWLGLTGPPPPPAP